MMIIERGKVYLMNDAYWLCVNDNPHDLQWEKIQDKKSVIAAGYTIEIAPSVENPHE